MPATLGHRPTLPIFTLMSGGRPGIPNTPPPPKCIGSSSEIVWASTSSSMVPKSAYLLLRSGWPSSGPKNHYLPTSYVPPTDAPFQHQWNAVSCHICLFQHVLKAILQANCVLFHLKPEKSHLALVYRHIPEINGMAAWRQHQYLLPTSFAATPFQAYIFGSWNN